MRALTDRTDPTLLFAIIVSAATIFIADYFLVLGIAVWVLYFVPIALSNFAWRPSAPLWTVAACSALLVIGVFVGVTGAAAPARYAPLNRTFGFVTMWMAALIGRRFIVIRIAVRREDWFKAAQTGLGPRMAGAQSHAVLGPQIVGFLADYLGAQVGAIYLAGGDGNLRRAGSHALDPAAAGPEWLTPGVGLAGQAVRDGRVVHVTDVPTSYLDVRSGLGGARPRELIVAPASNEDAVQAVIELGFFRPIEPAVVELLTRLGGPIASAVRAVTFLTRQRELLEETQRQGEELQAQQEELRVQNEELEQQRRALQTTQGHLENQQAELEQINSQLGEQTRALEERAEELMRTQGELRQTNEFKSEFLANMSHELRTPLNSSLILAKLLMDNREGNLTAEQIKFAQTIYAAGNDLLTLINDILDLSKIEAGKLDVRPEPVPLVRLIEDLAAIFRPVAHDKSLQLTMDIADGLPPAIQTDPTRLQQILKNLLSNALKFTERGAVELSVRRTADGLLAFAVKDTGIGIPAAQHDVIFEAFRQADGTTNRKYGGTGLGLSISRDLARLLGGQLSVESAPGRGSTFTLRLPLRLEIADARALPPPRELMSGIRRLPELPPVAPIRSQRVAAAPAPAPASAPATGSATGDDDRRRLTAGGRSILIVEDDVTFAHLIRDLARELEFQTLLAHTAEDGLAMAAQYRPSAIVLDVGLPDRSGLSVLDALKHNAATRHIPVHVISGLDYTQTALQMGAAGYALKPVPRDQLAIALRRLESKFTQKVRRILVVEDDDVHRESTVRLLAGDDIELIAVGTAADALRELGASTFDCMVLDLTLPDRSGLELLEEMSQQEQYSFPPVIVYTGRSLTREQEQQLRRFSQSIIVKGARSPERLLDEVTLFLHQVEAKLPPERQRMLRDARHREAVFEGRRVLIVEDDVRNIFALSSVLEPKGAKVEIARNGKEALAHLRDRPGVDLVLMDIMMPEMDGLECMRELRKQPQHAKLPIIALTAKAMADDREACLAAGANDYIAKPLDVDRLLSLARVWMAR